MKGGNHKDLVITTCGPLSLPTTKSDPPTFHEIGLHLFFDSLKPSGGLREVDAVWRNVSLSPITRSAPLIHVIFA
jgi:hypothetical protein